MSSLDAIRKEFLSLSRPDAPDFVRRKYLKELATLTGRGTVLYAVDFISPSPIKAQVAGNLILISLADKDGFDEVTRNLTGRELDVILHSPGGSAEAVESIVELLRARFDHIRFIVPSVAKSAATMLALSGNRIVMDEMSELGPTDPQMIFVRDGRLVSSPAQAIKDQFDQAQKDINGNPANLPSWVPLLREYGPSLLAECDNHIQLGRSLIEEWTRNYLFAGEPNAATKAETLAEYFSNHNNFGSHNRRVGIEKLKQLGVNVLDTRTDPALRQAIRNVYHALTVTFDLTGAVRIFENHNGEALVTIVEMQQIPANIPQPAPQQPIPSTGSGRSKKAPQSPRGKRNR